MTAEQNDEIAMLPIAMTPDERVMLNKAETTIRVGLRTFLEVGEALATIRDNRLYRGEFTTFEDYCQTKWDFTARRSRQLIDAHDVVAALPMGTIVPVNESQARALVGLTPVEAAQVMETTAGQGKVTGAAIREVRRATFLPSGKPDARSVDDMVNAVPPVRQKVRRRSLPDAYRDAVWDLEKVVKRLERLTADDRLAANAQAIEHRNGPELQRLAERLHDNVRMPLVRGADRDD